MISLVSLGGIGNRMRSIDSAISLSKKINHTLKIYWLITPECVASYYDLFMPLNTENVDLVVVNTLPLICQSTGKKFIFTIIIKKIEFMSFF